MTDADPGMDLIPAWITPALPEGSPWMASPCREIVRVSPPALWCSCCTVLCSWFGPFASPPVCTTHTQKQEQGVWTVTTQGSFPKWKVLRCQLTQEWSPQSGYCFVRRIRSRCTPMHGANRVVHDMRHRRHRERWQVGPSHSRKST